MPMVSFSLFLPAIRVKDVSPRGLGLPEEAACCIPRLASRRLPAACCCLVTVVSLQVWGGATDAAEGAETGAVARMHSALIAVVAHLLTRLGAQALSEAQVPLNYIRSHRSYSFSIREAI